MEVLTQSKLVKKTDVLIKDALAVAEDKLIKKYPEAKSQIEEQFSAFIPMLSPPSAISLTLDLICEKLNITEEEGEAYVDKMKDVITNLVKENVRKSGAL